MWQVHVEDGTVAYTWSCCGLLEWGFSFVVGYEIPSVVALCFRNEELD
jgi:hypothetical protein